MALATPAWVDILQKLSGPAIAVGTFLLGIISGAARDKKRLKALELRMKRQEVRSRKNTVTIVAHTALHERYVENADTLSVTLGDINSKLGRVEGSLETYIKVKD